MFAPSCPVTNCDSSHPHPEAGGVLSLAVFGRRYFPRGKYTTTTTVASTPRPPRSTLSAAIHCLFRVAVSLYIAEALDIRLVAGCSFCLCRYVRPFYIWSCPLCSHKGKIPSRRSSDEEGRPAIALFLTCRGRSLVFP